MAEKILWEEGKRDLEKKKHFGELRGKQVTEEGWKDAYQNPCETAKKLLYLKHGEVSRQRRF